MLISSLFCGIIIALNLYKITFWEIFILWNKKRSIESTSLQKKKKAGTLTDEEAAERAALHQEYINDIRRSFGAILDNTVIEYPDGSRKSLKK